MLTRLWRNRKMAIAYYAHFHRPFPFDPDSTWVRAVSFIDDLSASGIPALSRGPGSIDDFRRYMPGVSDARFAHIFGQQAAEYWLNKRGPNSDFVGCSTYRRYLAIDEGHAYSNGRLITKTNPESVHALSSDIYKRTLPCSTCNRTSLPTAPPCSIPASNSSNSIHSRPCIGACSSAASKRCCRITGRICCGSAAITSSAMKPPTSCGGNTSCVMRVNFSLSGVFGRMLLAVFHLCERAAQDRSAAGAA